MHKQLDGAVQLLAAEWFWQGTFPQALIQQAFNCMLMLIWFTEAFKHVLL